MTSAVSTHPNFQQGKRTQKRRSFQCLGECGSSRESRFLPSKNRCPVNPSGETNPLLTSCGRTSVCPLWKPIFARRSTILALCLLPSPFPLPRPSPAEDATTSRCVVENPSVCWCVVVLTISCGVIVFDMLGRVYTEVSGWRLAWVC